MSHRVIEPSRAADHGRDLRPWRGDGLAGDGRIRDPPMRGALRTLLRIPERKGHLSHRSKGREFVYRAIQPRGKAGRLALARVLDVFFGGSLENAVAADLSDPW